MKLKGLFLLVTVAVAGAALWPAVSGAATFRGIVVAKERGTLLVASSTGLVRAVRGSAPVGARVTVGGGHASVVGHASTARVRGIVVRSVGTTLFISSNRHLLALHTMRRLADTAPTTPPAPGTVVSAQVGIANGQLDEQGEDDVGQVANGSISGAGDGRGRRRRLRHAHRAGPDADGPAARRPDAARVARRSDRHDPAFARWRTTTRAMTTVTAAVAEITAATGVATASAPHESAHPHGRPGDGAAAARTEQLFAEHGRTVNVTLPRAPPRPRRGGGRGAADVPLRAPSAPERHRPARAGGVARDDRAQRVLGAHPRPDARAACRPRARWRRCRERSARRGDPPRRPRRTLARDRGAAATAARRAPPARVRRTLVRRARGCARRLRRRGRVAALPRAASPARSAARRVRVTRGRIVDRRARASRGRRRRARRGEGRGARRRCGGDRRLRVRRAAGVRQSPAVAGSARTNCPRAVVGAGTRIAPADRRAGRCTQGRRPSSSSPLSARTRRRSRSQAAGSTAEAGDDVGQRAEDGGGLAAGRPPALGRGDGGRSGEQRLGRPVASGRQRRRRRRKRGRRRERRRRRRRRGQLALQGTLEKADIPPQTGCRASGSRP